MSWTPRLSGVFGAKPRILHSLALVAAGALLLGAFGQPPQPTNTSTPRFTHIDVYLDSADTPLAAYQVEFKAADDSTRLVGIEGGEHAAYKDPPYYDPAALADTSGPERVILAAFNTGNDLPAGKSRVARLHLQVTGTVEPQFTTRVMAAATADGAEIPITVSLETGATK